MYKKKNFLDKVKERLKRHYKNCLQYKKFIKARSISINNINRLVDLPFLHVNNFKENDLYSIKKTKIFKILNSSSTTGSNLSKIYLDKKNSKDQLSALKNIMANILGKKRLPMLIIEKKPTLENRNNFGAKYAAIFGFSIFGNNHTYLLNEEGNIDYKILNVFLKKFSKEKYLIFGFTFTVFEKLIAEIAMRKVKYSMSNGILLHGGGWKKMEKFRINNSKFSKKIFKKVGIKKVYNYYGLIEQTGSIFIECEKCRKFLTTDYSDVIIRRPDMSICNDGEKGIIQIISTVPSSYPGNSILVEDVGIVHGKCKCNNDLNRKCFTVLGRLPKTEIRGCSDTIR